MTRRTDADEAYRQRILRLEEIEDDLRLLADTDLPIADRCENWLAALERVRGE